MKGTRGDKSDKQSYALDLINPSRHKSVISLT